MFGPWVTSVLGRPKGWGSVQVAESRSRVGLRPLRPTACAIFRRSLSLLDNVVPPSFSPLFSFVLEIILHPNPIFGTDFVGKDLTLPDLEELGSPPFRLPCQRCSAYGIRLKPTPDMCKGFWDYFCGVKWRFLMSIRTVRLRRSSVGFLFFLLFPHCFRFFAGSFRVAEGRGRDLWHPSSADDPHFFFVPLHYLPLKRTFVLESLEVVDQLGIFFLYFLLSFPRSFLDLVVTPQYLNKTYTPIT